MLEQVGNAAADQIGAKRVLNGGFHEALDGGSPTSTASNALPTSAVGYGGPDDARPWYERAKEGRAVRCAEGISARGGCSRRQ